MCQAAREHICTKDRYHANVPKTQFLSSVKLHCMLHYSKQYEICNAKLSDIFIHVLITNYMQVISNSMMK